MECLEDGSFQEPEEWPRCVASKIRINFLPSYQNAKKNMSKGVKKVASRKSLVSTIYTSTVHV